MCLFAPPTEALSLQTAIHGQGVESMDVAYQITPCAIGCLQAIQPPQTYELECRIVRLYGDPDVADQLSMLRDVHIVLVQTCVTPLEIVHSLLCADTETGLL